MLNVLLPGLTSYSRPEVFDIRILLGDKLLRRRRVPHARAAGWAYQARSRRPDTCPRSSPACWRFSMRSAHRDRWYRPRDFRPPIAGAKYDAALAQCFPVERHAACDRRVKTRPRTSREYERRSYPEQVQYNTRIELIARPPLVHTLVDAVSSSIVAGRDVAGRLRRQGTKDVFVIDAVRDEPNRSVGHREHHPARMITAKATCQLITAILASVCTARRSVDAGRGRSSTES